MPFTIFAFGAGWNCGSVGDTPPVLGPAGPVVPVVEGAVVELPEPAAPVPPKATAGANAAPTSRQATSGSGLSTRFSKPSFVRLPG